MEDKVAVVVAVEVDRVAVAVVAWIDHRHHRRAVVVAVELLVAGTVVAIVALVGMVAEQQEVVVVVAVAAAAAGNCHKRHKVVVGLEEIAVVVVGVDTCQMVAEELVDASLEVWPEVAVVVDGIAGDHREAHHHIVVTFDNRVVL